MIRQDENRKVSSAMETFSVDARCRRGSYQGGLFKLNYKGRAGRQGASKIIRRFSCVGGIDLFRVVVESADPACLGR